VSYWNYRLIVKEDGKGNVDMEVHECFYDDGEISWTVEPVTFGGETQEAVIAALEGALSDARKAPPLIERDGRLVPWEPSEKLAG
jgi:hypothetical protein